MKLDSSDYRFHLYFAIWADSFYIKFLCHLSTSFLLTFLRKLSLFLAILWKILPVIFKIIISLFIKLDHISLYFNENKTDTFKIKNKLFFPFNSHFNIYFHSRQSFIKNSKKNIEHLTILLIKTFLWRAIFLLNFSETLYSCKSVLKFMV